MASTDTTPTSPETTPAELGGVPIQVTEKALNMIRMTREQEGMDSSYGLRVAVRGGGCSGFEYALDFDQEQRETDFVIEHGDLKVFVDAVSARYLHGTTIDYVMGVMGSGFKFENPNATGSCGCGSSFSM
jgi:iron-sulfur cluster assembly accessory protein